MKVLLLNPGGSSYGGAERSIALLVRGLVEGGHVVHACVLSPGDASDLFAGAGADIVPIPSLQGAPRHGGAAAFAVGALAAAPSAVQAAREIRRVAHSLGVDLVHSNGFRTHVLAPLLAPVGPPIVWSLRDIPPSRWARALLRTTARSADAIAATSRFTAAAVAGRRGLTRTIPNPVEAVPAIDREEARSRLGLPLDRFTVAVVGHLHPSKGQHVVLEALREWHPDTRPLTVMAGGTLYGPASERYRADLERTIMTSLAGDVRLLGAVADVAAVYAAADVVVIPSIHPEGFGRVVVEAQSAGTPVVASAAGGLSDLVDDGITGLLVRPGDPVALADALRRIEARPELRTLLAEHGRRAAVRYSPEAHVDAMTALYDEVLAR